MIDEREYIRIVLGLRSMLRSMKIMVGDMPLKIDQRMNICSKLHKMSDDVHVMYMDLKDQGLLD